MYSLAYSAVQQARTHASFSLVYCSQVKPRFLHGGALRAWFLIKITKAEARDGPLTSPYFGEKSGINSDLTNGETSRGHLGGSQPSHWPQPSCDRSLRPLIKSYVTMKSAVGSLLALQPRATIPPES